MKLNESDKVWVPEDYPQYLVVIPKEEAVAKDHETFLIDQVRLLRRLVQEANEGEVEDANRRLQNNLSAEELRGYPRTFSVT